MTHHCRNEGQHNTMPQDTNMVPAYMLVTGTSPVQQKLLEHTIEN